MKRFFATITKYLALAKAIFYKKRLFNILFVMFSYAKGRNEVPGSPFLIQIEPTNKCILNCNLCITGLDKLRRPKRDMTLDEFTQVIDQFEDTGIYLVLYNLGEPLLNSQIYRMVEYAKKKKIFVKLSTSGYFDGREHIKNIVSCGIDELIVSLDCVSPQEYFKFKNNPSFEKVVENIKRIVDERGHKNRPFISVQLLLTRDNEKEISRFASLVRSLKADKGLIKKVRVDFPDVSPQVSFLPTNSKYIRRCYREGFKRKKCYRPWISTVILSDNSVVPCCFDMHGEYNLGNTSGLDFNKIWNNEDYKSFRRKIISDINQISLCSQCSAINFFDNFAR